MPRPRKRTSPVVTDEVKEWIQGYFKEDERASRLRRAAKQRHTAWRIIYERPCSEHAFAGSYEW